MKRDLLNKTWEALDNWVTDILEEAILTADDRQRRECTLDAEALAATAARFRRLADTKSEVQRFFDAIGKDRAQRMVNMGLHPIIR